MAAAHADHPTELHIKMQDDSLLSLERDAADQLVVTQFTGAGKHAGMIVAGGSFLMAFGPWPGWDANRRQGLLTKHDEESGLYEPERLFVLREQYVFLAANADQATDAYISIGPIHKAYWEGTQSIVQARQRSGKH